MKNLFCSHLSSVSEQSQKMWRSISKKEIKSGRVQQLSDKGLTQVVNNIAYTVVTESYLYYAKITSDECWDYLVEEMSTKLDEIQYVAALASGVHPEIVEELVQLAMEFYHIQYDELMYNKEWL
ncbi:MAG: hypothetical protein ACXWFB_04765 [Nitrososphaeraceae archaeon]